MSEVSVAGILGQVSGRRDPRVVSTFFGYNTINNAFALVVKESRHAALLMALPAHTVSDDGYGQRGYEVPRLDASVVCQRKPETVWRARRTVRDGVVNYWDGRRLYSAWDGEPALFDYCD